MKLPPEIFKAYYIRGIVGRTLTGPVVELIGQAIGSDAIAARKRGHAEERSGLVSAYVNARSDASISSRR